MSSRPPIGNTWRYSLRALSTLAAADAVIAEDTRVTKILLAHYGISTPLVAYHEHNAALMRPHLVARLTNGAALALVSDAGTPLISDPGYKLGRLGFGRRPARDLRSGRFSRTHSPRRLPVCRPTGFSSRVS